MENSVNRCADPFADIHPGKTEQQRGTQNDHHEEDRHCGIDTDCVNNRAAEEMPHNAARSRGKQTIDSKLKEPLEAAGTKHQADETDDAYDP